MTIYIIVLHNVCYFIIKTFSEEKHVYHTVVYQDINIYLFVFKCKGSISVCTCVYISTRTYLQQPLSLLLKTLRDSHGKSYIPRFYLGTAFLSAWSN